MIFVFNGFILIFEDEIELLWTQWEKSRESYTNNVTSNSSLESLGWVLILGHYILIKEFPKHLLVFFLRFIDELLQNFDVFHVFEEDQARPWVEVEHKVINDESFHELTEEFNYFLSHESNDCLFDARALEHIFFVIKNHIVKNFLFLKMTSDKGQGFLLEQ